ncbi:YqcI/YcgG family protein [Amycolatopsis pithecellobii]|nr:YqcI/YcgG family protein [Amycolatopsis pithecellobii]
MESVESGLLAIPGEPRSVPWEDHAARSFEDRMLDTGFPFPCIFGVDAVKRRTLRYCFVPIGPDRTEALGSALREFAGQCAELGKRTSLVAFFQNDPELRDLRDHERVFWALLAELMATDTAPWPAGISTDTESSTWEFSYAGVAFFVVANTAFHTTRRSRYFDYLAITFQPRFVFDDLSEQSPAGRNARKIIRARLREYDDVPPHASLGSFGDEHNREWVQYFLPDNETVVPGTTRCPVNHGIRRNIGMSGPQITTVPPVELPITLRELLPQQGSIELQHDQPGKMFTWHQHDLDEELYVIDGGMTVYWVDQDGAYHEQPVTAGARIQLPANTVHGSTAAASGCHYVIKPDGGRTAVTRFLPESQWPHPPVPPEAAR